MTKSVEKNKQSQNNNQEENPWLEIGQTIVMALLLSFGIRTFVAEARYIPSESMVPTLLVNDKLIVEKMTYRFNQPQRGDVIVFSATEALEENGYDEAFIKRIIGVPNDEVELKGGNVLINGFSLKENYLNQDQTEPPNSKFSCANQKQEPFLLEKADIPGDSRKVTIPNDSYLVFGDNRANSYDGRCWGLVPKDKIIGRAFVRFWPPQRMGAITKNPVYAETIDLKRNSNSEVEKP